MASSNQELLNALITKELSQTKFKELKDNIKINDTFLSKLLSIQRRRTDIDSEVLKFLSESVVSYIQTGVNNLEWLEEELDSSEINSFHKSILRKMNSIHPKSAEISKFLGYYAM